MSDKTVKTDITADASQANREWQGWAANVQAAAASARAAIGGVASGTGSMHAQVKNDLGKIEELVGAVTKRFAVWAAAVAGGSILKGMIDTTNQFTKEAIGLSKALGINTREAATLNVALGDVYSSADAMTGAASKLAKQLRTNEGDLNALGLATRDSNGNLRNMRDLMLDALNVLNQYEEGTSRTIALQIMFGKGAEDVGSLLKLNNEVLEEARKKQEQLGLTVSVQNVEGMKRYRAAMNDVGDVLLAIQKVIGDAVLPIFTKLGEWFAESGPARVLVIRGAIGGLVSVFWGLKNAATIAWEVIDSMVFSVAEPLKAFATAMAQLLSGDFAGATQTMMNWPQNIANRWGGAWKSIIASSKEARDRIADLFIQGPEAAAESKGGKKLDPSGLSTAQKAPSRMAQWEADLAERKAALTREGLLEDQYREMGKAAELAYWTDLKNLANLSTEERTALTRKAAEAELAMIREAFDGKVRALQSEAEAAKNNLDRRIEIERQIQAMYQQGTRQYEEAEKRVQSLMLQRAQQERQLRDSRLQAERDMQLQEVELARITTDELAALGLVNREQVLQAEMAFEQRRFQIQSDALQQRLAAAAKDPSINPVERERILREIEQLEMAHQLRMGKLGADAGVAASNNVTSTLGNIQNSWAGLLQQLAAGQITIGGFIKGLFRSVAQAVVQTLSQMVAQWAIQQIAMRILGKTSALAAISVEAAKAGAGGVASMAAAPFPLNLAAPAYGAAMAAAAMAFTPMLAAEQGFNIPAGVNPIVQAHQREMILPATLSDTVRDMAQVYSETRGGDSGAGGPIVIHGAPDDTVKVRDLAKLLRTMKRDFIITKGDLR